MGSGLLERIVQKVPAERRLPRVRPLEIHDHVLDRRGRYLLSVVPPGLTPAALLDLLYELDAYFNYFATTTLTFELLTIF